MCPAEKCGKAVFRVWTREGDIQPRPVVVASQPPRKAGADGAERGLCTGNYFDFAVLNVIFAAITPLGIYVDLIELDGFQTERGTGDRQLVVVGIAGFHSVTTPSE